MHGGESVAQFLELGIPAGRINSIAMGHAVPEGVQRVGRGAASPDTLGTLAAMVVDGAVEIPIAGRYGLSEIADAFTFLEKQHLRGKVVVAGGE
jgi:NADPH:quinone reductase-like Zn-dependent oxidoreductase